MNKIQLSSVSIVGTAQCAVPTNRKDKAQKAFTLIELAIVVIIISILSFLSVVVYEKVYDATAKRDAKTTLNMIRGAEVLYKIDNNTYYSFVTNNEIARGTLRVNVYNSPDWNYTVTSDGISATAVATRMKGSKKDSQIKIDIGSGVIVEEYSW